MARKADFWINKSDVRSGLVYEAAWCVYEQLQECLNCEIEALFNPDEDELKYSTPAAWVAELRALSPAEKGQIDQVIRDNVLIKLPEKPDLCEHGYDLDTRFGEPTCPKCHEDEAWVLSVEECKEVAFRVVKAYVVKILTEPANMRELEDWYGDAVELTWCHMQGRMPAKYNHKDWVQEFYYDGGERDPNNLVCAAVDRLKRHVDLRTDVDE